jgi:hypothetical protein
MKKNVNLCTSCYRRKGCPSQTSQNPPATPPPHPRFPPFYGYCNNQLSVLELKLSNGLSPEAVPSLHQVSLKPKCIQLGSLTLQLHLKNQTILHLCRVFRGQGKNLLLGMDFIHCHCLQYQDTDPHFVWKKNPRPESEQLTCSPGPPSLTKPSLPQKINACPKPPDQSTDLPRRPNSSQETSGFPGHPVHPYPTFTGHTNHIDNPRPPHHMEKPS